MFNMFTRKPTTTEAMFEKKLINHGFNILKAKRNSYGTKYRITYNGVIYDYFLKHTDGKIQTGIDEWNNFVEENLQ